MFKHFYLFALIVVGLCFGCTQEKGKLPVMGNKDVIDGKTVYHKISDFKFINQDSNIVTNQTFEDKVYIVDVFFTSCPTICPKVKKQMLRIYDKYQNNDRVSLISHSIDTRRDSVPRLKDYANKLEIDSKKWHLVTGDKEKIYDMADEYFLVALEDPSAAGGYDHSGTIILVDQNRLVRAHANGLIPEEVDGFMNDIDRLLVDNSVEE